MKLKTLFPVTVVTTVLAMACATSPRAASGPSPNVGPRDTARSDSTRDTVRTRSDTSAASPRSPFER